MQCSQPLRKRTLAIAALASCGLLLAGAVSADKSHDKVGHKTKKKGKAAQKPTLYMIGYSHLDTQWCWTYPQVIREFIPNTLHENFALFPKYPDYVFNWTGSNRYRFMKEYYPEDYATLKTWVAKGRWFPAGSSVEEGDVNSPSEESLIRQVMYGNEFFRREFGTASSEYMLPDCFGFPASLPSILAHCGLKGFSTQKLTWGSAVGIPFDVGQWTGPDGYGVVAALNAHAYDSDIREVLSTSNGWEKQFTKDEANGYDVDYSYYGVGDRGGAPHESSVVNLEKSIKTDGPITVVGGRADKMFNALTPDEIAKMPSYKGDLELTQHSAGSLTSEGAQKRWNRKNELLADATERASVAADWLGALPYDKERITDAWLRFLPGQFHDLMAGTALPLAYTYTWNDEVIALNEFAGQLTESVGGVAQGLDTTAKGTPVVVYNPLSIGRTDVVEATVPSESANVVVFDPNGNAVPTQVVSSTKGHVKVLFLATVPSVGFASYDVRPSGTTDTMSELKVSDRSLENGRYKVELNDAGDVSSIYDKRASKELLKSPMRLAYEHENPTQFPAWNMDWADQSKPPRACVDGPAEIKIVENGSVRVALQVTRRSEGSKFVQTVRLAAGEAGNRVEFSNTIDWRGEESALKTVFPLTVSNPEATYNWELGTVKRGNNDPRKYEVANHKWFDLTDKDGSYGVSILDDCKYGSDKPDDSTLRLTMIYTPGTRGGYQHQGTQDWGRNEMLFAVAGHQGDWTSSDTQWQASRLSQPLLAFSTPAHTGPLGKTASIAQVSTPQVSVEALKKAEDSNEIIVRLNELSGQSASGVKVTFASPVVSAREVNGQELPVGPAMVKDGALVVDMTAYHPRAFAVKLGRASAKVAAPKSMTLSLPYNTDGISSWKSKSDGNLDGQGRTIPGELLPSTLVSDGVTFKLGPTKDGEMNVVAAHGQSIKLPAGKGRRISFLASSTKGDVSAAFKVGDATQVKKIQAWDGYIGQWDTRLWKGVVPELTYGWDNPIDGLVPGYIKRSPVAWYADHRRLADGTNDIYAFCYMFRYDLAVPDNVTEITLPENGDVKIFAATVVQDKNVVTPLQPLYDTLDRKGVDGPTLSPSGGSFTDATTVTFGRPLFWKGSDTIHYTVDGTTPTLSSPTADGSIILHSSATLKVAQFDSAGKKTGSTSAEYTVNDTTPPAVKVASAMAGANTVQLVYSEPVEAASAEDTSHYMLKPALPIQSARVSADGLMVTLKYAQEFTLGTDYSLTVNGVKDLAPTPNATAYQLTPVKLLAPAFSMDGGTFDGKGNGTTVDGSGKVPTLGKAPWSINMFVYTDKEPGNLTVLGGYGDGDDNNGAERFLVYFNGGIEFWGSNVDINSGVPFDLNRWQMVTMTYDGNMIRIYKDGKEIKSAGAKLASSNADVKLAPVGPWEDGHKFEGKIAGFTVWKEALPADYVQALLAKKPAN